MKLDFLDLKRSLFSISMLQALGRENIMSQAELVFALNHLPISMMAFTMKGNILFYNQNFSVLCGLDDQERMRHINELPFYLNELRTCVDERVLSQNADQTPVGVERATVTIKFPKRGFTRRVGFSIRAEQTLFQHEGSHIWVLVASDITNQEHAQHEDDRMRSDLYQSRKQSAVIQQLTAFTGYLFDPLFTISQHNELMRREIDQAKAVLRDAPQDVQDALLPFMDHGAKHIELVETTLGTLQSMFKQVKGLKQPLTLQAHPANLALQLRQWVRQWERDGTIASGVSVSLDTSKEIPLTTIDVGLVKQAVRGLVQNSIDACQYQETPLHLEFLFDVEPSATHGYFVHMSLSDNGCGLSAEACEKVFDPLYTTKSGHMMGLGLTRIYRIMEAHHGFIHIEPRSESRGTIATLSFPQTLTGSHTANTV